MASAKRTPRNAPQYGTRLCSVDDIPDGTVREFVFGEGTHAFRMFVVRRGENVWGYLNTCPHFSIPLNVQPDRFVTSDHTLIMCANHSSMFRYENGLCVDGPCKGARLDPVPVKRSHRWVVIEEQS